ncbi:hypothetical protein PsAD46_02996 [Pseudovibrio sp. Ad46]|uniref:DUF1963 domain-containing protein n=1 Tax=unclassified Pseudovibrio TaxID=2627060 RepID=UPI0007AE5CE9|nr:MULTISPECIES: DUF1963 domain-containing protein [unclassified Pseudovibrio]KZK85410.1 hypothetical protein PsAD46_02996 [Pseudovibrio sp. Ad46]KZK97576.1 hypothetical protein PsAD5_01810 [Pseudovibrio sp. Ad5]
MRRSLYSWFKGKQKKPPSSTSTHQLDFESHVPIGAQVKEIALKMQEESSPEKRYTYDELHDIIVETKTLAIGMARVYPPDPTKFASSYLGGLPRLPADVAWPRDPISNKPRMFLGQIDCATLPRSTERYWLPKSGTLWFFAGPDLNAYFDATETDTDESHVIYRGIDASFLSERNPPDAPPWWEGPWGEGKSGPVFGPQKLHEIKEGPFPTVLAKWPLEFALFNSYRDDWNQSSALESEGKTEEANSSDIPRIKRIAFNCSEQSALREIHTKLLWESWIATFGVSETRTDPHFRQAPWEGTLDTPITWLAVRRFCVTMNHDLKHKLKKEELSSENEELILRAIHHLSFWLNEADKHPIMGVMPDNRRLEFLNSLKSIADTSNREFDLRKSVLDLRQTILGRELNRSIHDVLKDQIWHPECGPSGFPPEIVWYESHYHKPLSRVEVFPTRNPDGPYERVQYHSLFHRFLGAQTIIYRNENPPDGYILLAEFSYDDGMRLIIGDVNSLTIWIHPDHLLNRDFSKVSIVASYGKDTVMHDQLLEEMREKTW